MINLLETETGWKHIKHNVTVVRSHKMSYLVLFSFTNGSPFSKQLFTLHFFSFITDDEGLIKSSILYFH